MKILSTIAILFLIHSTSLAMASKEEVIAEVAENSELSQAQVLAVLEAYVDSALLSLGEGREVILPGLGKFTVVLKKARQGRNPRTGEIMTFVAKTSVRFKAIKSATDAVN